MSAEAIGYMVALAVNVALLYVNLHFATKVAEGARRNLVQFIRLTTNCPNCLHYEALCDGCRKPPPRETKS